MSSHDASGPGTEYVAISNRESPRLLNFQEGSRETFRLEIRVISRHSLVVDYSMGTPAGECHVFGPHAGQVTLDGDSLGNAGIAHALVQEALTRRHHRPLSLQPPQRDRDLLLVAAAHPVRQDIDLVPVGQQVQRRLRHTDMRLDADDDDLVGAPGRQGRLDLRQPHGEGGLVDVAGGLHAVGAVETKFRASLAEAGAHLGGGVNGELQNLTCNWVQSIQGSTCA